MSSNTAQRTGETFGAAGRLATPRTKDYALPSDFCRIFDEEMDRLYGLALLLTGDRRRAEECLVAALDDCLQNSAVFREWASSWARRAVIHSAARMIPALAPRDGSKPWQNEDERRDANPLMVATRHLSVIDRFVYVMCVLERYTDRECAMSLAITPKEVAESRLRALAQVALGPRVRAEYDSEPRQLSAVPRPQPAA